MPTVQWQQRNHLKSLSFPGCCFRAYLHHLKMASANGRLTKELSEVGKDDKTSGVKALPLSEGNLRQLKGTINGPIGTCYEGGVFEIDIQIPKQYPFEPPKMKFLTKIWHPNISSQTGAICLVRKNHCRSFIVFRTKISSLILLVLAYNMSI